MSRSTSNKYIQIKLIIGKPVMIESRSLESDDKNVHHLAYFFRKFRFKFKQKACSDYLTQFYGNFYAVL